MTLRVASALALACAELVLGYFGGWPFAVLIAVVSSAMGWEWSNIVRKGGFDTAFILQYGAIVLAIVFTEIGQATIALLILAAGCAIVAIQQYGRKPLLSGLGVAYVGIPAISLIGLRLDPQWGFAAMMFVLAMVWTSDTFALVSGKTFGGPKLWPALSPRKTWAGLAGATLASAIVGALYAAFVVGGSIPLLAITGLVLGVTAQIGDLGESALKRHCQVKDASDLIPGHGGFLDRMDGVVTAAPLAVIIGLISNVEAPARALLFGM